MRDFDILLSLVMASANEEYQPEYFKAQSVLEQAWPCLLARIEINLADMNTEWRVRSNRPMDHGHITN